MLILKFVYICLQNNNFVQHNSIWKIIIVINVKSIKSRIQILYILYIFSYHFFQKMILFFFAILYYIQGEIKFNCSDKSMWRVVFDVLRKYVSKRDIVRGIQHAFQSVQIDECIFSRRKWIRTRWNLIWRGQFNLRLRLMDRKRAFVECKNNGVFDNEIF